jgi:hypothetical protein
MLPESGKVKPGVAPGRMQGAAAQIDSSWTVTIFRK